MKNIRFTIYTSDTEKYNKIVNYRTLLEILLIRTIQDKINREKSVQRVTLMFDDDLESDNSENFRELYYGKNVQGGIISLSISTKNIDWNLFSDQDRKAFLIEKWKVLFNNLSDDYFVVDKSEVIDSLEELRKREWKHTGSLFKKKLKYKKEAYSVVMDISVENAKLALLRDSDEKRFILREYEKVWRTMSDANFKNFKLDGDILTFENKTSFLPAEVFDLKQILKEAI